MKKIKYLGYTLSLLLLFGACEQETIELQGPEPDLTNVVDEPCPPGATAGSADFTKFVTIGNSLTAGYQAGALFNEGQANSLSKILAEQFECVGGSTTFNQPDINSELGFNTAITPNPVGDVFLGRLLLQGTPPTPQPTISSAAAAPSPVNPAFMYTGSPDAVGITELNNFGVPGIQLGQALIPQTGDWTMAADPRFNPYYARFASTPGTSTILSDAISSLSNGGTFFSFWLGNNDVLGYAISGATNPAIFTSTANFEAYYNSAIDNLLAVPNVKGVVGNIPNVTTIPYFTTVTWDVISFDEAEEEDVASVTALNSGFAGFNAALDGIVANLGHSAEDAARRKVSYSYGNNPVLILDEELEDLGAKFDMLESAGAISEDERAALAPYEQARPITEGELITLSAGAILGTLANPGDPTAVIGAAVPLTGQYTLTTTELAVIQERIDAFNAVIANTVAASDNRIALADVNAKFTQLATNGFDIVNGVTITPALSPPTGGFSEDGVHPNNRGYAYLANIFIDAINAKFGATVPKVNLSKYKSTALPINP